MKRRFKHSILLLIGLIACLSVFAQKPQQRFNRANHLYQKQAYDSALAIYAGLIDEGYDNAALFFNAGNASYNSGRSGYAVYYFTKALQQDPGNEQIQHNLRLAQLQASNKIEQLPTLFFVRWWHVVLRFLSVNAWLIGSIVFFWILIFFIGWKGLAKIPPPFLRWIWIPLLVLFGFFMAGAIFSRVAATTHDTAIVIDIEQPLREAPDNNSSSIEYLQKGAKVEILDSVENWKKVRLVDGTEGWFNAQDMKTL